MPPDPNPYQPAGPVADAPASDLRLAFDGEITEADYAQLLPNRRLSRGVQIASLTVLFAAILLVGGVMVLVTSFRGSPISLTRIAVLLIVLCGIAGVAVLGVGITARTRASLKRAPDLVGRARGEFSVSGLTLDDGRRIRWFGPATLVEATVLGAGIRVPVDTDLYHYLAFTSRLVDGYTTEAADQLRRAWRAQLERAARSERPTGPEQAGGPQWWTEINKPPAGAIAFQGPVMFHQPRTLTSHWVAAVSETAVVILVAGFCVLAFAFGEGWIVWGSLVGVLFSLASCYFSWRRYWNPSDAGSYQWGWISESELAWCDNTVGLRLPLKELTAAGVSGSRALIADNWGTHFLIPRDQLADESQWEPLAARLRGRTFS